MDGVLCVFFVLKVELVFRGSEICLGFRVGSGVVIGCVRLFVLGLVL